MCELFQSVCELYQIVVIYVKVLCEMCRSL